MEIICPECQFSREVDETKVPPRSQVATCPKCHTKFKFRELPEEEFDYEPSPDEPAEQPAPASGERKPAPGPRQGSLLDQAPRRAEPKPEPAPKPRPAPKASPTPEPSAEAQPVLRPTVRKAPEEPAFPNLPAAEDDNRDGLWDRLDRMAPPEKRESAAPGNPAPTPHPAEQQPVPGWTGEFNDDFPDPMMLEAREDEEPDMPMQVPPPFEQLDRYGFFHGLFLTIKLILLSPRLFFSVMPVGGGLAKPLTFTILVTMIQSFAQYIWGVAGLSASTEDAAMSGMSTTMSALAMLLLLPAFITVAQFVLTGVYHVLLILMRGDNKGFEGTFRALVYSNAPIVLGIFPMPTRTIEIAWMFIVAVWGLALTILGLKHIHNISYAKVVPVALVPLLLAMIAALSLYQGQFASI
ncbi:MAG: YIP1 family protein [Pseudodesulfovibrio sp.]